MSLLLRSSKQGLMFLKVVKCSTQKQLLLCLLSYVSSVYTVDSGYPGKLKLTQWAENVFIFQIVALV